MKNGDNSILQSTYIDIFYSGIPENLERNMQSVVDSIAWSARSVCVIGNGADFVTFFSKYVPSFAL